MKKNRTRLRPEHCDALICVAPGRKPRLVWPSHLTRRQTTAHQHFPLYSLEFAPNGHRLDRLLYDLAWVLEASPKAKQGSNKWLRFDLGARARQHCSVMGIGEQGNFEAPPPLPSPARPRGPKFTKKDPDRLLRRLMRAAR